MSSSLSRSKLFKSNKNLKNVKNLIISGPIDKKDLYILQNQQNQNNHNHNQFFNHLHPNHHHQQEQQQKPRSYNNENHIILIAKYSFQATTNDELSILPKKFYKLIKKIGNGWLLVCEIENNSKKGLVPASYMEIGINDLINPITLDWLHQYKLQPLPQQEINNLESESSPTKSFDLPIDCLIDEIYQDLNTKKIWFCIKFQYDTKIIYINRDFSELETFNNSLKHLNDLNLKFPEIVSNFSKLNSNIIKQFKILCINLHYYFEYIIQNLNHNTIRYQLNQLIYKTGKYIEIFNDDENSSYLISKLSSNSILIDKINFNNYSNESSFLTSSPTTTSNFYFNTESLQNSDSNLSSSLPQPSFIQQRSFSTSSVPVKTNPFNSPIQPTTTSTQESPKSLKSRTSLSSPTKQSRASPRSRSRSSSVSSSRVFKIPDQLTFEDKEEIPNTNYTLSPTKNSQQQQSHLKFPESISSNTLMSYTSLIDGYEDTSILEEEDQFDFSQNIQEEQEKEPQEESQEERNSDQPNEEQFKTLINQISDLQIQSNLNEDPQLNEIEKEIHRTTTSNINRSSKRTDSTSSSTMSSNNISMETKASSIDSSFNQNKSVIEKSLSPLKTQILQDYDYKVKNVEENEKIEEVSQEKLEKEEQQPEEVSTTIPNSTISTNKIRSISTPTTPLLDQNNNNTLPSTTTTKSHNSFPNSFQTISTSTNTSPIIPKTPKSNFFTNVTPPLSQSKFEQSIKSPTYNSKSQRDTTSSSENKSNHLKLKIHLKNNSNDIIKLKIDKSKLQTLSNLKEILSFKIYKDFKLINHYDLFLLDDDTSKHFLQDSDDDGSNNNNEQKLIEILKKVDKCNLKLVRKLRE
ncbi:hypothetical protein KGF54_004087 [Candida jiufengensis]|uniref:uncharacterized protein n=1 Tax=Candida jiufengensis TaxID=497108 RepID=UPI0022259933|nr:uncharacterized protein KGF54_004087 [Candida jiufengensis]KAI5951013.1 hypothetical protein KGF54_004087 [Candida jiufengensis]